MDGSRGSARHLLDGQGRRHARATPARPPLAQLRAPQARDGGGEAAQDGARLGRAQAVGWLLTSSHRLGTPFEMTADTVIIDVTVRAVDRTGVEVEAMTGAALAALTIYDMLKMIDDTLSIEGVRLLEKRGGKSDHAVDAAPPLRAAVLVASDRWLRVPGRTCPVVCSSRSSRRRVHGLSPAGRGPTTPAPSRRPCAAGPMRTGSTWSSPPGAPAWAPAT